MPETISNIARSHLMWALTDGIGPIVFARLLVRFGNAETALGASAEQLRTVHGIGRETVESIARSRDEAKVEAEVEAAAEHGLRIICQADPDYPEGLKRIADPPIVLYVKGELLPTDALAIAIVGTRRCTIYGSEQARRFGELLAQAGFTVVSGLARGIDAFAHHGAVDADGRSIAVFGRGLDEIYPPDNRALAEKLLEHGAWLSELPVRTAVRRENFPSRNRIIAGLTLGTLVVEAPQRSGALITARLANEYNRGVFAIPGRVQDPTSFGSNALIRDGAAKLVTCLDDILEELGEVGLAMQQKPRDGDDSACAGSESPDGQPAAPAKPALRLSPVESRVYEVIGYEPMLQDAVLAATESPPGEVLAAFTSLELKGLIKRLPGNLVVRTGTA
ncbi:MAG TPA: DNA-processing protein DprA [Phycisphaerae bacterium]|nr:DNA-processing protein DprA [Phycisphaerae bacterium]